MRMFSLSMLVAMAVAVPMAPAQAEVMARPSVVIDADVVRLGDLFDGLTDRADIAVARAPAPGKRVTIGAEWLAQVARANGVAWKPNSIYDQTVLERAGVTIGQDQILAELRAALIRQGVPERSDIELSNRDMSLTVPMGSTASLAVRDLVYDARGRRFSATLEMPAGQANASRVRISGRVFATIDVPVLAHPINRGDVVTVRDLTWTTQREDNLRRDIILDPEQMAGMAARQTLRSGQMVSISDLQKPIAVSKGALVTILLQTGGMTLSAQGRAVDQGAIGDIVHVVNTRSNMTIEARVDGPNQVRVGGLTTVALAN